VSDENQFNQPPLPPADLVYLTTCHPEAMGRIPQDGDRFWTFLFTLEDGRILELRCGKQCRDDFREMLFQEEADDAVDRLLGS